MQLVHEAGPYLPPTRRDVAVDAVLRRSDAVRMFYRLPLGGLRAQE
jgi:hypothetical protein